MGKIVARQPKTPKPPKIPRENKKTALKELEKHVQKRCVDFMVHRRWRAFRNNPLVAVTVGGDIVRSGEKNEPDYTFVYYFGSYAQPSPVTLTLHVEFKRQGELPRPGQLDWHRDERVRGGLVWVIDDSDVFQRMYWGTFAWLHNGSTGTGQREILFEDIPIELRPTNDACR